MPEGLNYGILSLVPLTITLILAFWKKDSVLALFIGCLSGVMILGFDPAFGFSTLAQEALGNEDFIWILLIQMFIGIMIAFFMKAGVVKAFAEYVAGKISTARGSKVATWAIGLVTIDDYLSPLLRGIVMRPITDSHRVSREKLSYILDSTCSSVCTIMPFMAWGAYVATLVAELGGPVSTPEQGLMVYIRSIPFNFYAVLTVVFVLLNAMGIIKDFGPMKEAEERAFKTGKVLRDGAIPMVGDELKELESSQVEGAKPHLFLDFGLPIIILVGMAIFNYIRFSSVKILESFITVVLYQGISMLIRGGFKDVQDMVSTAVKGMKGVMTATIILALAYCINVITKSMGSADFIIQSTQAWMTPVLFIAATFLVGALISFFTGTSWGTYAIMVPIAVPLAYQFTGGQLGTLVYAAVGAVVSGGLFGDHCSPVSDTTVLSSLGAGADHIDHVRTQLPYAVVIGVISLILWVIVAAVA